MLTYAGVNLSPWQPDVADYVEGNVNVRDFYSMVQRLLYPGAQLPWINFPGSLPSGPGGDRLKLGKLFWPRGASRFASIHLLVDDAQLLAIRGGSLSNALGAALPFTMSSADGTVGSTIATNLMALPPLPLERIGGANGVNLLTLVDDRWNWWTLPEGVVTVTEPTTTWLQLYALLATALGITLSVDAIPAAYLTPSKQYTTAYDFIPVLLDAIAYSVGQRFVRYLDGTCAARNFSNSLGDIAANLALPSARSLVAGGLIALNDVSLVTAGTLAMVFPQVIGGVVGTPHVVSKPTGATGPGTKSLHSLTVYDGTNATQLAALATQAALDYAAQFTGGGDWKFAGIALWKPEAIDDGIEWAHNAVGGQRGDVDVSTRIYPPSWNDLTDQLWIAGSAGSFPPPGTLVVQNIDSTQQVLGCTLIEADDDLGDNAAYNFGRIHWTKLDPVSGQLDWQGFRIYTTGTGYKGPEPDLEFIAGANITISIADDPGDKRTQVTISAVASSGTVETMNLDATQATNPATVIKFNNDLGTVQFGRLRTTDLGGGVAKVGWQGFRLYKTGTGYVGPEPDLEFIPSTGISITVADDPGDARTQVTIASTISSIQTVNLDTTQSTSPASVIKFNNDLGTARFGRMHTQNLGAGVAEVEWQGFRIWITGTGYVGPEPDLAFVTNPGITITLTDDAANFRTQASFASTINTINTDGTQATNPVVTIKLHDGDIAYNTAYKFGRLQTTDLGSNAAQIDWQGFRLYKSGTGYVGPEPDLEFSPGYGIGIGVSDDPGDARTVAAFAVGLSSAAATLVSDVTLSTSWQNLGALQITMGGAGTYLIQASLTGLINVNPVGGGQAWIEVRLRNTSAGGGGATIGSEHIAVESQQAGTDNMATATPMALFAAAGGEVITCQGRSSGSALGAVTAKILQTADGDHPAIGGSYMLSIRIV